MTEAAAPQLTAALTINGGKGNDTINLNGPISFASGKDLNVDLQDDDASPGTDAISLGSNADLILQGSGKATLKASKSISLTAGSSIVTASGEILLEANQQSAPTSGDFIGINLDGGTIDSTAAISRWPGGTTGHVGVYIQGTTFIGNPNSTSKISITGKGGSGNGSGGNIGVVLDSSSEIKTAKSTGAGIQRTGTGGTGAVPPPRQG